MIYLKKIFNSRCFEPKPSPKIFTSAIFRIFFLHFYESGGGQMSSMRPIFMGPPNFFFARWGWRRFGSPFENSPIRFLLRNCRLMGHLLHHEIMSRSFLRGCRSIQQQCCWHISLKKHDDDWDNGDKSSIILSSITFSSHRSHFIIEPKLIFKLFSES